MGVGVRWEPHTYGVEENKKNNKMAQSANLARSNNITRSKLLDKKSTFVINFKNLFLAENQQ